jgi:NADP-dependent 3-hydroxy acid dehydrogenase YdfG
MTRLDGKVAIVTGASRGIGAATARALAAAGASVALAARDVDALERVAGEVRAAGGRALAVPTDIRQPAAVEELVGRTVAEFGGLDIAFNNAAGGGHPPTPLTDVAVEDFDSALAINLRGTFLCMKYEIPAMLDGGGGAIVNMASTAGLEAVGGLAAYVSSKHGIVGLTKVAASSMPLAASASTSSRPDRSSPSSSFGPARPPGKAQRKPCRCGGSASPRRSPRPWPGCAATRRRSSPVRSCRSTAARWPAWRRSPGRRPESPHRWCVRRRGRCEIIDAAVPDPGPATGRPPLRAVFCVRAGAP